MIARVFLAALLVACSLAAAFAAPSRIIILRHGEKEDVWRLCAIGEQRAQALAANHLKVLEDGLILQSQAHLFAARGAQWTKSALAAREAILDRLSKAA